MPRLPSLTSGGFHLRETKENLSAIIHLHRTVGGGVHGNRKRGACGLDATCITDFKRGEASGARG
jgi:hypothetical protein